MVHYLSPGPDAGRFLERFDQGPADNQVPRRAALLKKLAELTWTDPERAMNQMGYKTYGQVFEENFWHRFAYHGFREFYGLDISYSPAIEEESGRFMVTGKHPEGAPLFHLVIPRNRVKGFLKGFRDLLPNQHGLSIHPLPLKSIFKISATTRMDLTVRPLVQVLQADGEIKYLKKEGLEKFRYGDLVYVKELGILAELEPPGPLERKFAAPIKMVLKKSQVPGFLEEYGQTLRQGAHLIDPWVKKLIIHSQVNQVGDYPAGPGPGLVLAGPSVRHWQQLPFFDGDPEGPRSRTTVYPRSGRLGGLPIPGAGGVAAPERGPGLGKGQTVGKV